MASEQTPILGLYFRRSLGENGWNVDRDTNIRLYEMLLRKNVASATTTAEPGAPSDGDLYIVPASATGSNWSGNDGKLAYYDGSASGGADEWIFISPIEGWNFRAVDTELDWIYDGSNWTRLKRVSADSGITASTTQTQGQQPLTANINEISTCANANDVVTAFAMLKGMSLTVINNGANTLQLYPASGDDIGAGVDTSVTVGASAVAKFECYSDGVAAQII